MKETRKKQPNSAMCLEDGCIRKRRSEAKRPESAQESGVEERTRVAPETHWSKVGAAVTQYRVPAVPHKHLKKIVDQLARWLHNPATHSRMECSHIIVMPLVGASATCNLSPTFRVPRTQIQDKPTRLLRLQTPKQSTVAQIPVQQAAAPVSDGFRIG